MMKPVAVLFGAGAAFLLSVSAFAQSALQAGDHVMVGSLQQTGTVIQIGGPASPGSMLVKVHLDSLPAGFDTTGSWFDEKLSVVTKLGGAAPAAAGSAPAAAAPPGVAPATAAPPAAPAGMPTSVPAGAPIP